MRSGNEKVFVYGTLKPNFHFGNLYLTQWEHFPAAIRGKLHMVNNGTYAGLNLDDSGEVYGYVYSVDKRMIEVLDSVEGCPILYRREKTKTIPILEDQSDSHEVWVYEYSRKKEFNDDNEIKHGIFEYLRGVNIQIPLLDIQSNNLYVNAMVGGIPLKIQNPRRTDYRDYDIDPLDVEHPCPSMNASINGDDFQTYRLLNGFDFYDHRVEGIDLLASNGSILTGIPVKEITFHGE